ncbi:hypothetical protein ACBP50_12185, partial [Escherichia coli]
GKNSLNRLIRCVCGKKIGPDPRNFNQRVNLGRNDLLIRTFLKLFYRPAGIAPVNKATFKKLLVNRSGNGLVIKNDSANWVTISDVKANNVKVNYETIMIAPLESQSVNVKSNNANNWHLTIIDDHGNYISDKI